MRIKSRIDLPIGSKFKYNEVNLEVIERDGDCGDCYFYLNAGCLEFRCIRQSREDGKPAIAMEVKS